MTDVAATDCAWRNVWPRLRRILAAGHDAELGQSSAGDERAASLAAQSIQLLAGEELAAPLSRDRRKTAFRVNLHDSGVGHTLVLGTGRLNRLREIFVPAPKQLDEPATIAFTRSRSSISEFDRSE